MNWLIIAPDLQNKNVKKIEDFLIKQKEEMPDEIFISSETKQDELLECIKSINKASHCVILDAEKISAFAEYNYIIGFLAGKKVETLIQNNSKDLKFESLEIELTGLIRTYPNFTDLFSALKKDFSRLKEVDDVHNSLIRLLTMGIPFTADSFAHYLEKDKPEIYNMFIDAGMSINAKTSEGVPLLSIAVRSDHFDQVKWLLDLGADINAISGDRGYTAVMDAVWRKNFDITKFLVDKGADLSVVSSDGQPILVLAVGNGNEKIVKLLLESGADADLQDSMGMSARGYANLFKKPGMVEVMAQFPKKEE
ncbi:MAG: ankyrin repeat domain-containing protein [Treponema sp.]|nr:ankyrin repeat domain-containing protein [Treponema sp.]